MSYPRLDRCDGPECPHCGCCDAEIIQQPRVEPTPQGRPAWWGAGMARCRNCRYLFHFRAITSEEAAPAGPVQHREPIVTTPETGEVVVPYVVLRCPKCRSTDTRVTSTRRPYRYHRCQGCGERFKSREAHKEPRSGGR